MVWEWNENYGNYIMEILIILYYLENQPWNEEQNVSGSEKCN